MDKVTRGATGPAVGALGLGCMGMSDFCGPADTLTPADLARLDEIAPPGAAAGDRCDAHAMALLESERGGRNAR